MTLNRNELQKLIPHSGSMCLLDEVQSWNETGIACTSNTHRNADNPLRSRNRLDVFCGVEYAAQAMAVHGALCAGAQAPAPGYLASVRDLACTAERLDNIQDVLLIEAERLMGSDSSLLYGFTVKANGIVLLSGRASVFLISDSDKDQSA